MENELTRLSSAETFAAAAHAAFYPDTQICITGFRIAVFATETNYTVASSNVILCSTRNVSTNLNDRR